MKHNTFLVKPASSLCNLRCRYCFYDDVVFDLGGKVLKTRSWVYIALMVAAFVANTVFDVNVVVVILAAAVFGVVLALVQWKKGGAK